MKQVGWLVALAALALPATRHSLLAQVSPGPLARAHAELEGTRNCTRCHGPANAMQARCLGCHRDIGWLVERRRGPHGSQAYLGKPCATCHPDHAGIAFELVRWPEGSPARFDHARAGWPLEQSHAKVECRKCHAPANRVSPAAGLAPGGDSQWTGLEQGCTSCHEDIHRGALTAPCAQCHDAGSWTVTPGFTHDSTDYPLTGRHREVGCNDCHLAAALALRRDARGRPIPVYEPVPHASCASCHRDVHGGSLGADCASCHSTREFGGATARGFDHRRTRFALRGRHDGLRCGACHRGLITDAGRRPSFATCTACHADPHRGTAPAAAGPRDCSACHAESGFTPSTWKPADHQRSGYPLEGKHVAVPCKSCHRRDASPGGPVRWGSSRVVLRPASAGCTACHADAHGRQLAESGRDSECSTCHALNGWTPSRFGPAEHATLKLPLQGRHADIDCRACHGADRKGLPPPADAAGLGQAAFAFRGRGLDPGCGSCHLDPHGGREERGAEGRRAVSTRCETCHDTRSFAPAAVDVAVHQRFRFPLEGAHRATPCSACHRDLGRPRTERPPSALVGGGGRFPRLDFDAPRTCEGCHRTRPG